MLKTLDDVISRLVEGVNPVKVVLFGSRARGEERQDSDIDLLVVADLPGTSTERAGLVQQLLGPRLVGIDVIVYTPAEYERFSGERHSFLRHVLETGRVVHEANDSQVA